MKPLTKLEYNGVVIRDRDDKLNLTDMWKAAGSDPARRPDDWKKDAGNRAFLDHVAEIVNAPMEGIWIGKRGRGGETWAHWQIGIAYAKHISPAFHAWCNQVVRDRMEGRIGTPEELLRVLAAAQSTSLDAKQYGGITKAVVRAALEDHLNPLHVGMAELAAGLAEVKKAIAGKVEDRTATPAREYVSALDYLIAKGVPQKGRRGVVNAVSARLLAFTAANGFPVRAAAETGTRLFHVDAIRAWEAAGGVAFLRAWRDRREGQMAMRLRPGRALAPAVKTEAPA